MSIWVYSSVVLCVKPKRTFLEGCCGWDCKGLLGEEELEDSCWPYIEGLKELLKCFNGESLEKDSNFLSCFVGDGRVIGICWASWFYIEWVLPPSEDVD